MGQIGLLSVMAMLLALDNMRSVNTHTQHTEALLVGSEESGLEVNTDKTKHVVMSGDQIAGQMHNSDGQKFSVDKKNQLDVTFCILYFSSNSCSTCFGQPCVHHQELTTA